MWDGGRGSRWAIPALLALASVFVVELAPAQPIAPRCAGLRRPDRQGRFVAAADLSRTAGVDGDDPLALVNRDPGGSLRHDYAPSDLVDLATGRPARASQCVPPRMQCLRAEAAAAYAQLEAAMRAAGLRPTVTSAFRDYPVQCATFLNWAARDREGLCGAATASALPGHSQHQLGTALDLFDRAWLERGDRFREGFGCSPAGRWLAAHAHEHGFVLPYPLHPDYRRDASDCAALPGAEARIDPRTGYRYEPWHLRYLGREHAARFHRAWLASGPGSDAEITLEQWLRAERGRSDVYAPVCDGCNCDRCATFADSSDTPCARPPLRLDASGRPLPTAAPPRLVDVRLERDGARVVLHARVLVADNTLTQPPVVTPSSGAVFARGEPLPLLATGRARSFPALAGAWRLAIGFGEGRDWPWKAALVDASRDGLLNGMNARVPAAPGELALAIPMERVSPGTPVRVALTSGDEVRDVRSERAP
jgi:D-alanyl-D-alanine carboxypeptidase